MKTKWQNLEKNSLLDNIFELQFFEKVKWKAWRKIGTSLFSFEITHHHFFCHISIPKHFSFKCYQKIYMNSYLLLSLGTCSIFQKMYGKRLARHFISFKILSTYYTGSNTNFECCESMMSQFYIRLLKTYRIFKLYVP